MRVRLSPARGTMGPETPAAAGSLRYVVAAFATCVVLGGVTALGAVILQGERPDGVTVAVALMYFAVTTTVLIGASRALLRASRPCWLVLLVIVMEKVSMSGPGNGSHIALAFHVAALVLLLAPVTWKPVWTARASRQ